jgi:hypothetical protein
MSFVSNTDPESFQLIDQDADFILVFNRPTVAQIFKGLATQYLVDSSRQSISDSHFGFVGGAKFEFELVVFIAVEQTALQFGPMCVFRRSRTLIPARAANLRSSSKLLISVVAPAITPIASTSSRPGIFFSSSTSKAPNWDVEGVL